MPRASPVASRHEQVSRQLRDDLAAGRYGQEGRLPSEAELARRFSVSRPTVARALQSLVEAGLLERRAGSGTFAKPGDVKKHAAPATRVLALLMPDLRKDVRVVGFDDVSFATLVSPALTTARQPCNELAVTAFYAMLEHQAETKPAPSPHDDYASTRGSRFLRHLR